VNRTWIRLGVLSLLVAVAAGAYLFTRSLESDLASAPTLLPTLAYSPELVAHPMWAARVDGGLGRQDLPVEFAFRRGETLSDALGALGFEPPEANLLTEEVAKHVDLRRLRPEDSYAAMLDSDSRLDGFRLTVNGKGQVSVWEQDGSWQSEWQPFIESTTVKAIQGELDDFLENSISRAGGHPTVAYVMADVLQWDLDFNRDLRLGDRFELLYEEVFLDGKFYRVGSILTLTYENGGKVLEAYRFGEDNGYYDSEGRPLQKLFLRSPLRFSRITSRFTGRRFHPVLKTYRPHYGVDYGAPTGTPVRVTANGVVRFAGWDRGGGKTIKVRHPNGYLTAYLHLSRFAGGIGVGRRVSQGEVIGYVGATGLATGPHLDYRIQRDGKWINPLTLDNKPAEPISDERLPEFLAWRDELRMALEEGRQPFVPSSSDSDLLAEVDTADRSHGSTVAK
jgi:murein DD-endopeptidase MepM/ murein hydrolase activator NlpD